MNLNEEYKNLTEDIVKNEYFELLRNDIHHGTNKYDHCKRVSILSFLLSKLFKTNIKEATRAGLLHDFFYGERTTKIENSYLNHPITSAKNAKEYFNINEEEVKIIESHMFHYALIKKLTLLPNEEEKIYFETYKPKGKNSVIVCVSDLLVSIYEVCVFKVRYSVCLYMVFLLNIVRY